MADRLDSLRRDVRITGGECRGRIIEAPEGLEVRPTASKIRQAFFNILNNILIDARFVDICAGSGLMGIEALSRGASNLIAIEENKRIAQAIESNLERLGLHRRAEVIKGEARRVLPLLSAGEADIIYVDPPYKSTIAEPIIRLVDELSLLSNHGVLAIEHAAGTRLPENCGHLNNYDRRKWGHTAISFYRRSSEDNAETTSV